ncbi:T9SS type A sorting domain-containing protein [Chitinophaga agrisoli]|uniref:T9SS type A sorting domain-containing protein n=1 Tax=Chitinophaga agrisoli TaxID=2607653 RepID=A0A5B2VK89_9BACT|nr:T9SS type A sorting domain-containing protein [Chitinophaga agrisoli]KAA2238712.1 T9SS type A sorting domain-containing protein [Chitinophaga agrisoli]
MRKRYPLLLLVLLCQQYLFAQNNDNNPLLSRYYTAPTGYTIRDFKYDHLLIAKDSTYRLINVQQHTDTLIPLGGQKADVWSTPTGAILTTYPGDAFHSVAIYEWNQGALTLVDPSADMVKVAGNYVSWLRIQGPSQGPGPAFGALYLRNLVTKQNVLIADSISTDMYETKTNVSKEGMVVFTKDHVLYKYENGSITTVLSTPGLGPLYLNFPMPDEGRILFLSALQGRAIVSLYNGSTIDTLGQTAATDENLYEEQQAISNGYTAWVYREREGGGFAHTLTYLRDSTGNTRVAFEELGGKYNDFAMTFIEGLAPNGDLMVTKALNPGGLYYIPRDSSPRLITTNLSHKVYLNSDRWYMRQDSILYLIATDTLLDQNITPFSKQAFTNTFIQFTANDFINHYNGPHTGPGQLESVQITSQPRFGRLTVKGDVVFWGRSNVITRAELDSMKYTPNPGIVGVDTLQWKAFNGLTYTKYDTSVALQIYPVLSTPPILRTLEAQYSVAGDPDTILIANYPATRWHTEVSVVVDGATVLPVNPDNTFIIDPAAYTPGAHQLKVTFWHPLDTISISRSFIINGALQQAFAAKMTGLPEKGTLTAFPSPFSQQFTVTGLSPAGRYILSLYDQQGRPVLNQRITGQTRAIITPASPGSGVYMLTIYDEDTKQVVNTLKLLRL